MAIFESLRQDHVAHLLEEIHAEAGAGIPLPARNRIDAAPPDFREEGGRIEREADAWQPIKGDTSIPSFGRPKKMRNSCSRKGVPWKNST